MAEVSTDLEEVSKGFKALIEQIQEVGKMFGTENGHYENFTLPQHEKLGLITALVYTCRRCNYLWLPKDYDYAEKNITQIPLPKSCARCKSKYWNKEPIRKINYRYCKGAPVARVRAYHRQIGKRYPIPKNS